MVAINESERGAIKSLSPDQTTRAKRDASARKISREARKQLEEANQRAHVGGSLPVPNYSDPLVI